MEEAAASPPKPARKRAARKAAPPAPANLPATPADPLDALAQGNPLDVIALMLWKGRHRNPEMAIRIDPQDISAFRDCVQYLKIKPAVSIARPAGRPATPAFTAKNGVSYPAMPADPPRPFVMVKLVEAGTDDAFKAIENNEQDRQRQEQAEHLVRLRGTLPGLANQVRNQAMAGEFHNSLIIDLAEAALLLLQQ